MIKTTQQGNVLSVYFDINKDWEQWFMLSSDRHHDSIDCNRTLEKEHLEKALYRDALIIDVGDLFDAMQGRFDPRRSYDGLRPEYRREDFYDAIVNDAASFYAPYAKNWLMMGWGNHESATLTNANTSVISRLIGALNSSNDSHIFEGGYGGWIRFMFDRDSHKSSINMKYFHGAGGEAPVTRGVIQTNRQAVYIPDADILLNGHNHNEYTLAIKRERISNKGKLFFDLAHFIRTPGYCNSYGEGKNGWDVERGGVPKPQGCIWMKMYLGNSDRVKMDFIADIE